MRLVRMRIRCAFAFGHRLFSIILADACRVPVCPLLCLSQAIIQLLRPSVVDQFFGEASPTARERAIVIDHAEILRRAVDAVDAAVGCEHLSLLRRFRPCVRC